MLHPSAVSGDQGAETIAALTRSHFAQGGLGIQFNIFDANVLRAAQRNPEKYANLKTSIRCRSRRNNKPATTTAGDRRQTASYTTDGDTIRI